MTRPGLVDHVDYLEHFGRRLVQDAMTQALAGQWLKRAKDFETAAPRPGDFTGRANDDEVQAQLRRAIKSANECRWKAWAVAGGDVTEPPKLRCPECGTFTSPWSCSCGQTRVGERR